MENRKIMLWKKPPYIEFSAEKFEASLKEFKVNDVWFAKNGKINLDR